MKPICVQSSVHANPSTFNQTWKHIHMKAKRLSKPESMKWRIYQYSHYPSGDVAFDKVYTFCNNRVFRATFQWLRENNPNKVFTQKPIIL